MSMPLAPAAALIHAKSEGAEVRATTSALDWYLGLEVHEVLLDGHPVRYRDVGQGPPIVFVHGWPLCGTSWRRVAMDLSKEFRCIIPDLPGAGESPLHLFDEECFAHLGVTLDRFCAALALKNYGLAGYDSGGAGCRLHAAKHPNNVKAMLLSNTEVPNHEPTVVLMLQRMARVPGLAIVFKALLESKTFRLSKYGFGGTFHDRALIEQEFAAATLPALRDGVPDAIAQLRCADIRGIGDHLHREVHPKLTMPVEFVWGANDPFFPLSGAKACHAGIPGARGLHVIEGAALLVHEEKPREYVRHARQFFREHLQPGDAPQ